MPPSSAIDLTGHWTLHGAGLAIPVSLPIPGDIHSALLDAGVIPDPYWRDTETSLDWVHQASWTATRDFTFAGTGRHILRIDALDCVAEVMLNGRTIGQAANQFMRHDFDATDALQHGANRLEVRFASSTVTAHHMAAASEIEIPSLDFNCRLPHLNFLRKTQCHAGWDWNIALAPLGIYGNVMLRPVGDAWLTDVMVNQRHGPDGVTLDLTLHLQATAPVSDCAVLLIDGQEIRAPAQIWPGTSQVRISAHIPKPRLWWPVGQGPQEMYDLTLQIAGETRQMRIGLRRAELVTDPDPIGARFAFRINGREVFARGANWIPADALPSRASPDRVRDALQSALDANMNMIRIWGGGQYEPDWFYEMCDEMGLMIWQDFMFACNLYPAHDRDWLASVRAEAGQVVRRLSRFACLTLWCGDNELVGALGWYDVSRQNRDRYLAIYDRLNHTLEQVIDEEAPDVAFWPSSPIAGRLDFGHVEDEVGQWDINDTRGDMHFWDVWHMSKDFEHYRSVRPRFCSEFGFQSFPSPRVIASFTTPADRDPGSKVMEVHQRNAGGNARIVETISRYFRPGAGFDDLVYLSQVSQGLAMRTAIEFWRACKPRCMGTLYWQLNDTWPVASWSGLEYGGGWKAMHYMARRFFADVLVTAQPDGEDIVLWAINDGIGPVDLKIRLQQVDVASGESKALQDAALVVSTDRACEVLRLPRDAVPDSAFLVFDWTDGSGKQRGESDYFPRRPKSYDFGTPEITVTLDGPDRVTLTTDRPAPFVTWDHGGDAVWSDNCVTLLPGAPRTLKVLRHRQSHLSPAAPVLRHLPA